MSQRSWFSIVEDAEDGSGDALIVLPQELLAQQGWKADDEFTLAIENGSIVLTAQQVRTD